MTEYFLYIRRRTQRSRAYGVWELVSVYLTYEEAISAFSRPDGAELTGMSVLVGKDQTLLLQDKEPP